MVSRNLNLAYNFDYAPERKRRTRDNVVRLPSKKARAKAKLQAQNFLLMGIVFAAAITAGLVSYLMAGQATLNELTDQATKLTKNLKEEESLQVSLGMKLKNMNLMNAQSTEKGPQYIETLKVGRGDRAKVKNV